MTLYRNFRIQSHLSRPVGNQSRQQAGFSLSTRKALKQKGLIVNTVMMVIVIFSYCQLSTKKGLKNICGHHISQGVVSVSTAWRFSDSSLQWKILRLLPFGGKHTGNAEGDWHHKIKYFYRWMKSALCWTYVRKDSLIYWNVTGVVASLSFQGGSLAGILSGFWCLSNSPE